VFVLELCLGMVLLVGFGWDYEGIVRSYKWGKAESFLTYTEVNGSSGCDSTVLLPENGGQARQGQGGMVSSSRGLALGWSWSGL
jgi:hypothetical protein